MQQRIVVVGAGHLGSVIIDGLRARGPAASLAVVEPAAERAAPVVAAGVPVAPEYAPEPGDLVVLAIPPQAFDSFAAAQPSGAFRRATVVSVMAGVPAAVLARRLDTPSVVRAMPNLASRVGGSMTVMYAGPGAAPAAVARAEEVLGSIGEVLAVEDEALLDDATALAGSGPAFVAYVAKAFTDFAARAGFGPAEARLLTCQVLRGTADLLEATGQDPERLYRSVATPGGTTEQGILALEEHQAHAAVTDALERAARRAGELGAGA